LRGNWSHWQPDRIRKMMPLRINLQLAWRRPVSFRGQNFSRIGLIRSHKSSGISQIVGSGLDLGVRFRLFDVVAIGVTLRGHVLHSS
jgi:hypothetical protein